MALGLRDSGCGGAGLEARTRTLGVVLRESDEVNLQDATGWQLQVAEA